MLRQDIFYQLSNITKIPKKMIILCQNQKYLCGLPVTIYSTEQPLTTIQMFDLVDKHKIQKKSEKEN